MKTRLLILITGILAATQMGAKAEVPEGDTMTGIFSPQVRTLTVELDDNRMAPAVMTLGSQDCLTIGFDMLSDECEYLRYSIYHCDMNWQLSDLSDAEVFDNFNYADIEDYAFSRGTTVHYVHYSIRLPNGDFNFKLSGNYLLRVYPEQEPDDVILQVRFMVTEATIALSGEATSRTDVGYNSEYQQLEINANLGRQSVRDPFNDLKLVVRQNGRYDNAVTIAHPTKVLNAGKQLVYDHIPELIFRGGNEYRRMETVQTTYPGMGVDHIEYRAPYYHHLLNVGKPRRDHLYTYDRTQHGRFFVREYNSDNSDIEADYTVVHFALDMPEIQNADVYLDGDFTHRRFDESSLMRFNSLEGIYHKAMLLKQGAYNYQFLVVPRSQVPNVDGTLPQAANSAVIEGDKYQTTNEYSVAIYYRAPGERYDRLLGYSIINSGK